jgi:hypothetical protein
MFGVSFFCQRRFGVGFWLPGRVCIRFFGCQGRVAKVFSSKKRFGVGLLVAREGLALVFGA